jgi:hypothetical protein
MAPLERYFEEAAQLAQTVAKVWRLTFPAPVTGEFKALFDKACRYQAAANLVAEHRGSNALTKEEEVEEVAARRAFAEAFKIFDEQHLPVS